jgi:hypothetical protein
MAFPAALGICSKAARARVARASRIYVEGRHDAELIAQMGGEDLRIGGAVVEHVGGMDDVVGIVAEFAPGPIPRSRMQSPTRCDDAYGSARRVVRGFPPWSWPACDDTVKPWRRLSADLPPRY